MLRIFLAPSDLPADDLQPGEVKPPADTNYSSNSEPTMLTTLSVASLLLLDLKAALEKLAVRIGPQEILASTKFLLLTGVHDLRIEIVLAWFDSWRQSLFRNQARAEAALRTIKPKPLVRAALSKEAS